MSQIPFSLRIRNLGRYRKVIMILIKYGFKDLFSGSDARGLVPKTAALQESGEAVQKYSRAERVRMVLEELGTTFIKLGQILSTRQDLVPIEYIREFEKLQNEVPEIKEFDAVKFVEKELKRPAKEIFALLDPNPMASASISQVHKARLMDGTDVILKMQRPEIGRIIEADLEIIKDLASLAAQNFSEIAAMKPEQIIRAFEKSLKRELRFSKEAASIKRFAAQFEGEDRIVVPKVYQEFCTDKLLCLEFIKGTKITDLASHDSKGYDRVEIAKTGVELYFQQIFEHGFFHADPHPGNVFVVEGGRLCFLDFGMMGDLLPTDRQLISELLVQFLRKDIRRLINTIEKISIHADIQDRKELEYEIHELIEEFAASLKDLALGDVINRFKNILVDNEIVLPANYFLLMRALVLLEGVGKRLEPNFNIVDTLKPYSARLLKEIYNPKHALDKALTSLSDVYLLAEELPGDVKMILDKLKKGNLKMEFEHKGLDESNKNLSGSSNRIALAILVAALITGSSLMVLAKTPPLIYEVPLVGILGFAMSGLLGVWMIWMILRSRQF